MNGISDCREDYFTLYLTYQPKFQITAFGQYGQKFTFDFLFLLMYPEFEPRFLEFSRKGLKH